MGTRNIPCSSPPGFQGLRPDLPLRIYRRNLPHWRQEGATYFVTFRLHDSIPQEKLVEYRLWKEQWERNQSCSGKEMDWEDFAKQSLALMERWLDQGTGECIFHDLEIARNIGDIFLHFNENRYSVFAYVVMPNHCHVVVKPLASWDLDEIVGGWKGYSAKVVNTRLQRDGPLWQEESYDRIIRDENHLRKVVRYIGNNPGKAGISKEKWVMWVCPQWEECRWGFDEL